MTAARAWLPADVRTAESLSEVDDPALRARLATEELRAHADAMAKLAAVRKAAVRQMLDGTPTRPPMTQREVGEACGLSQARINQILA